MGNPIADYCRKSFCDLVRANGTGRTVHLKDGKAVALAKSEGRIIENHVRTANGEEVSYYSCSKPVEPAKMQEPEEDRFTRFVSDMADEVIRRIIFR